MESGTGKPVGGAVVIAAGDALQGERSTQTDGDGAFLFAQLPPGTYSLNVQAPGHQPATQENVVLSLDATLRLRIDILREGEAGAAIGRAAQVPVISAPSLTSGGVVSREQAELIPYGRERLGFEEPLSALPGVLVRPGEVSVQEGSSAGTRYVIDGLDVTGSHSLRTRLPQRFVEQVSLLRGIYPAEFGRSSGAIVHAETRSGGNELHGAVFGSLLPFEASAKGGGLPVDLAGQGGFELGGPIERDRLWFFAGLAPEIVKIAGTSTVDYQYAGKLTFRPGADQSIALSAFGDPQSGGGSNDLSLRYRGKVAGVLLEGSGGVQHLSDEDRVEGSVSAATFAELLGHHFAKAGADVSRQTMQEGTLVAAFAQDSWAVLDAIFLDAGLRYEAQHAGVDRSVLLPRAGLSYDFTGRGLSRIYAGIGRFYTPADGLLFPNGVLTTAVSAGAQLQFYRDAVASIDYLHQRNFDGVIFSLSKPLSQNYLLEASYALSSASPQLFSATSILKLDAAYLYEWNATTTATFGAAVHVSNSLAWEVGIDARAALRYALSARYTLALNLDVLNALNHQADQTEGPFALRFGASLSF